MTISLAIVALIAAICIGPAFLLPTSPLPPLRHERDPQTTIYASRRSSLNAKRRGKVGRRAARIDPYWLPIRFA